MTNATITSAPSPERRRWPRKLGWFGGGFLVLIVVLYFVATSSAFFKGFILPRVAKSLNAEITVADASISPFSQVVLRQLKVTTTGADPLVVADEVRARYSLWSILGGNIKVDEVTIASPVVHIVQNADGTSNLDPLLKKEEKPAAKSTEPLHLEIRNVALKNATVRSERHSKDGTHEVIELSDINVGLDQLKNGAAGKLTLAAAMKMERAAGTSRDALQSKGSGTIDFALGADLMPQTIKGQVTHEIVKAEGALRDFTGHRSQLNCDITATDVKNLGLEFRQADKLLGALRVSGPFDINKLEGRLKAEVLSIDRQVLNLAGAGLGWDFGNSAINATNLIEISQKGSVIAANGKLAGRQLGIKQGGQSTTPLDLDFDYQTTVNLTDKTALVQKLDLRGIQGQNNLLRATLDRPMNLTWGQSQPGFKESSLQLVINKLNLADLQPFLNGVSVTGKLDAQLNLLAQQDGRQLKTSLNAKIQELSALVGSNKVERATVQLQLTGQLDNFQNAHLDKYSFEFGQPNRALLTASGSASYNSDKGDLNAQTTLDASLPGLLQLVSVPQLGAAAGTLKLTGLYSQKDRQTSASGNLVLGDFTGRYGEYQFQNYQTTFDFDLAIKEQLLQIRRLALALRQGFESGGSFDVAGKYDLTKQSGEFTFNTVDLNQNALRPFLAPALAPNKLVSTSLNGKGSANCNLRSESSVKAEFKLANLVVEDPKNTLPKSALSAELQLDGSLRQQLLTLRQLMVKLSPTDRAKNELQLAGKVDLAKTNATPSEVTLRAESLDVTPYYDLFAGKPATAAKDPDKKTTVTQQATSPPTEPEPVSLPFQQFTFDAKIDRFFLREIAASNFVATAKIHSSEVVLKPFQLTLNGAPVTANALLNLGVKGWTYDVSANADRIPLEPIANSFAPESRGQYQGLILANMQIKGAGITDANLKKSLTGQFGFGLTNANIKILPSQTKILFIPINLNLIATLLNIPEIMQSPITGVDVRVNLGDGKINLKQSRVSSSAFVANVAGVIPMADVLTNSPLNMPVELWLTQSLARKLTLSGGGSGGETGYAKLPTFVTVVGTIGKPDYKEDKLALGGLLLKSGVGIAEKAGVNVGGKTGNILKGVGELLTGQKPANTNDTSNTNPPPKLNPFNFLPKKK